MYYTARQQRNKLLFLSFTFNFDTCFGPKWPSSDVLLPQPVFLFVFPWLYCVDRLCGLVFRVPGYRSRVPGFDSRRYHIF
jgi:hypothetical protein